MISIQILEGREAIERIADDWDALVGDTYTSAFSGPAWYLAWLDAFKNTPVTITARADGRLVGVLPLARVRMDARGLYLSIVCPFARGDYQPPIVDPTIVEAVLTEMLQAAFHRFGRRGVYWWANLPDDDPGLSVLRSVLSSHGMPYVEERESAPRLCIDGRNFSEVEQGWAASHRKDIRRQRKRLAEKGPVSIWRPASVAEGEPVLKEFFEVHDAKWLSQGFPGMFRDPRHRLHFQALLKRMLGRGLHFSTLRCGDTHISYHFGFFAGGWIQWYRPSFRLEFQGFSPSKIHVAMLIEEACQAGQQGLDFLLGAEAYKDIWTNETREVVSIHAGFHKWSPSYFWFSRGKPYMRQRFQWQYLRARAWVQKLRQ
jgi:CelD/BcsL family acetyltransferase involved in cellulose biosynthesis